MGGCVIRILQGDCRAILPGLPDGSVDCCVTSPPYFGLRDYGSERQIGLESSPDAYVAELLAVFRQVRRTLRADGTLWLNLGDSYFSPRWNGGVGANSTINGKEGQAELRKARRTQRGGMSGNKGNEHHDEFAPNRAASIVGLKPKDLIGIPWMVAFALRADGWYLRQDIIWHKPNPMPESVTDRPTKAHEYLFLLSKSEHYYYDAEAIKEPSTFAGPNGRQKSPHGQGFARRAREDEIDRQDKQRGHGRRHAGFNDRWDEAEQDSVLSRNKRSVWTVTTKPFPDAHFATFPPELIEPCVLAGAREGGIVLDPFGGAGTTGLVADRHHRDAVLIELNPEYAEMARKRCERDAPLYAQVERA
jgi:DNA modification methylase